ncbi:hypothetical protein [Burkholderia oklahomensis]|uniref:hypothetical protein n=1 Tax=Burkholderia oklahomensis TaxID=342113 RepID=UPI003F51239E
MSNNNSRADHAPAQAAEAVAIPDESTFQRLFIKHGGPVDSEGWCINESGLRDFLHELAAAPQRPAQADARDEDAYVAKRLSEALADVYTTLIGDDKVDADESLNAIERVERAAQVLRLEVELYRGQADAREGLTEAARSALVACASTYRINGLASVADEIERFSKEPTMPHDNVLTYANQPGNVGAWKLGEACRAAKAGGDPIDHGLSLLKELQARGYGVVDLVAHPGQPEPRAALLYEHDDGRYAVAPSAEEAHFTRDDPAWHRVGPVTVYGSNTAPHPEPRAEVADAMRDVLSERHRQVEHEGWTPEHDDEHDSGEMPSAAACYALSAGHWSGALFEKFWPAHWSRNWWKPTTPRRDLVKAGSLILAEIERLDRSAAREGGRHAE